MKLRILLVIVVSLVSFFMPANVQAQEGEPLVQSSSVDNCQYFEIKDNYSIGNWRMVENSSPRSGQFVWQTSTQGIVEGLVPIDGRAGGPVTIQVFLDLRKDSGTSSRKFQVDLEFGDGKRYPLFREEFDSSKLVVGSWLIDQASVVTTGVNGKNLLFKASAGNDTISFDRVIVKICQRSLPAITQQQLGVASDSKQVTWIQKPPVMANKIYLPLLVQPDCNVSAASDMCPVPGSGPLPKCPEGQYLIQEWPVASTHKYFRCVGGVVEAAQGDMAAAAVAVAVASGAFAITPFGWVVIGAVVVGSVVYTMYLVDSQTWELYQYKDSVEIYGDPWIVDEWFNPSLGVMGPQTGYVLQDETQTHLIGDQLIEGGTTILKSKVDPAVLFDKLPLWVIHSPSQNEAVNAIALVMFKSDFGAVYSLGIYEAAVIPDDWETQQRIELLQNLDDLITPPVDVPTSNEEGETVWFPPTPGTPEMRGSGHTAKPGTIFWTLKQSAWNLLWNYILGDAAVGGNGGGDFDWCGVRKDGIRSSTGEPVFTVAMVKYDVVTYFKRITTWAAWLGRNPDLTGSVRGAILMINDKNPSAWWGVVKSVETGLPEYTRLPTPNGKVPRAADWSRYTRVPCNMIETFKCLTNPAGCIPPSMLPG